ncbi:MAG: M13 family metallopeptidase [Lachnospiraceae bacterium]
MKKKNRKTGITTWTAVLAAAALCLCSLSPCLPAEAASVIATDSGIEALLGQKGSFSSDTVLGDGTQTGTPSLDAGEGVSAGTARSDTLRYAGNLLQEINEEMPESGESADVSSSDTWQDTEVYGVLSADTATSRKDDFYAAVNQDWITDASVSDASPEDSVSSRLSETVEQRKKSILTDESLKGQDAETVRTMYDLLLDWETRNEQGIAPVMPFIAAIQQIKTVDDLTQYLCTDAYSLADAGLVRLSTAQYQNNPEYYAVEVGSSQLLLNISEYGKITRTGKLRLSYAQSQCYYMLERIGYTDDQIDTIFQNCIVLESALADAMETSAARDEAAALQGDVTSAANKPCSEEDLATLAGDFPIEKILKAKGLDGSLVYNLPQPDWLVALGEIYNSYNLEYFRDYFLVHTAIAAMELTDSEAFNVRTVLSVRFLGTASVTGGDENVAYAYVDLLLGRVLDNVYIETYCKEEDKKRITDLTQTILSAYRQMLENSWLSDSSKEEAEKKLDSLTVRVDYPDSLPNFSSLHLVSKEHGGTLIQAYKAILTYSEEAASKLVNQKVDDSYWLMAASTVNCYYNAGDNSINILAGMLQEPFYSSSFSNEELLSGIGFVIAHEITHAFDLSGSAYDATGAERNWWTDEDEAIGIAKWNQMADYYSTFTPLSGGSAVTGEQVASEAMADLGGMQCILRIANKYPAFDYDAFFTHFASCWACLRLDDQEAAMLLTDEHPLNYLRVNILLQQFQKFYDTYDIKEGDGMYLAPEKRISFW